LGDEGLVVDDEDAGDPAPGFGEGRWRHGWAG
jgi:hypothetical protein